MGLIGTLSTGSVKLGEVCKHVIFWARIQNFLIGSFTYLARNVATKRRYQTKPIC